MRVPSEGTTALKFSARRPLGAMCTLVLSFSMMRSEPVLKPVSAEMADIFESEGAVGDKPVRWSFDVEIGVERARGERSALRHVHADGGEKVLQILCGHIFADELHIHDGVISLRRVGAVEAGGGGADFNGRRIDDAGFLAQIVTGIEINGGGNACR